MAILKGKKMDSSAEQKKINKNSQEATQKAIEAVEAEQKVFDEKSKASKEKLEKLKSPEKLDFSENFEHKLNVIFFKDS